MRSETPFKPEQTNAHLKMENINDVAVCSTNRFSLEEEDVSTLTCDKFKDYGCMSKNDDLLPILTEREGGCGPATEMPSM